MTQHDTYRDSPVSVHDGPGQHRVAGSAAEAGRPERVEGSRAWGDGSAEAWTERSRIVLSPVAAPSILGLFGFFAATFAVGSQLAGWWGTPTSPLLLFPFALVLGGVAQFLAGMWAYRARDGLATAMHGIWGSFWMAWGVYQLLVVTGNLPAIAVPNDQAFGFWWIPLTMITFTGALAALGRNVGLFLVLGALATGSGFAATGFIGGYSWSVHLAGWLFVASAAMAWYVASAMLLEGSFGRTILPVMNLSKAGNVPGRMATHPIEYAGGMPGSRVGQ